jgi:hypothetical protein
MQTKTPEILKYWITATLSLKASWDKQKTPQEAEFFYV